MIHKKAHIYNVIKTEFVDYQGVKTRKRKDNKDDNNSEQISTVYLENKKSFEGGIAKIMTSAWYRQSGRVADFWRCGTENAVYVPECCRIYGNGRHRAGQFHLRSHWSRCESRGRAVVRTIVVHWTARKMSTAVIVYKTQDQLSFMTVSHNIRDVELNMKD